MQFYKGMECILHCIFNFSHIEGSAEERVKYSSTKIWNVF